MAEILKKNIVHVYERFEQETEEQILNGSLKAGDCIISENEAAERYKISRRSARTAIEHLISSAVIITFVNLVHPSNTSV